MVLEGLLPDPMGWLRAVHAGWTVPPDQTYLLVLPIEQAVRRLGGKHRRREHFEQEEVLRRVQEAYITLAEAEPWRFVLVDATKEKREVARFVEAGIRETVERSRARRRS